MFNILFNEEDITIERKDAPVVDQTKGNVSEPVEKITDARAKVEPVTGNELMRLSEGYKDKDVRRIFSETELRNNDTITLRCQDDIPFKAIGMKFQNGLLHKYYEGMIVRDN